MKAVSDFFFHLYTKIIVLLVFLLIELILLVRNLKSHSRPITNTHYLRLIEQKNPTICYTNTEQVVECTVCLSEFEEGQTVRNLKCKHTFHKDCLDKWLLQCSATCPLCRNKVLPDHVVSNYHQQLRNQVDYGVGNDQHLSFLLSALRDATTLHTYL